MIVFPLIQTSFTFISVINLSFKKIFCLNFIEQKEFFDCLKIQIGKLEKAIKVEGLEKIVDYWLKRTYEIGAQLEIKDYKGERFTGRFKGIDSAGGILISTGDKITKVYSFINSDYIFVKHTSVLRLLIVGVFYKFIEFIAPVFIKKLYK